MEDETVAFITYEVLFLHFLTTIVSGSYEYLRLTVYVEEIVEFSMPQAII